MRYWVTTHWPPRIDEAENGESGVWLPEGREAAGKNLSPGDMVVIYQALAGRTEIRKLPNGKEKRIPCRSGKGGVVQYGKVTDELATLPDSRPEHYTDGTTIWWRWFAPVKILSRSGFVPRVELAHSLRFKPKYPFKGFGTLKSGLKEITKAQYQDIITKFHSYQPIKLPKPSKHPGKGKGGGPESQIHKDLKEYVANNPIEAIGEGTETLKVEYTFPTGDRADIVLNDSYQRILAVEIEPAVGDGDLEGPLQAIKYRYMLEMMTNRAPGDSRAILIAHSISQKIQELCNKYGIHCIQISKKTVAQWRKSNPN